MKRDLRFVAAGEFDVLIVGGGIYGAACLREASLRGLSAALLEKDDFCGATSANSLKLIHGGLRYLQQLDFLRMRESIAARRALLRTAPHLVHPIACLMPTTRKFMKSRPVLSAALAVNDLVSWDRNRGCAPDRAIAPGHTVPQADCLRIVPGLPPQDVTGGAVWHDACAYSTERLSLAMIESACAAGATAANYVKVTGFMCRGDTIEGVHAKDLQTGAPLEVRARLVINNTGPWTDSTLALLPNPPAPVLPALAMGMNVVLKGWPVRTHAVGLMSQTRADVRGRLLFFVPWREHTIAGTYYRPHFGAPEAMRVTDEDVDLFLADLNAVHPDIRFSREDITMIHAGLLPATAIPREKGAEPDLSRHALLVDHGKRDMIQGLFSVVGVKYTTAVTVAADTITLARARLAKSVVPSPCADTPLDGGDIPDFPAFVQKARASAPAHLPRQTLEYLLHHYGTNYQAVLDAASRDAGLLRRLGEKASGTAAEVLHAVRNEMATTLSDIVYRRTDLGTGAYPEAAVLRRCADLAGAELGWDDRRKAREIANAARPPWLS